MWLYCGLLSASLKLRVLTMYEQDMIVNTRHAAHFDSHHMHLGSGEQSARAYVACIRGGSRGCLQCESRIGIFNFVLQIASRRSLTRQRSTCPIIFQEKNDSVASITLIVRDSPHNQVQTHSPCKA